MPSGTPLEERPATNGLAKGVALLQQIFLKCKPKLPMLLVYRRYFNIMEGRDAHFAYTTCVKHHFLRFANN